MWSAAGSAPNAFILDDSPFWNMHIYDCDNVHGTPSCDLQGAQSNMQQAGAGHATCRPQHARPRACILQPRIMRRPLRTHSVAVRRCSARRVGLCAVERGEHRRCALAAYNAAGAARNTLPVIALTVPRRRCAVGQRRRRTPLGDAPAGIDPDSSRNVLIERMQCVCAVSADAASRLA